MGLQNQLVLSNNRTDSSGAMPGSVITESTRQSARDTIPSK